MSYELLSRSVGDERPPIVTDSHGSLNGALTMLEVMFDLQMDATPKKSTLTMPTRESMIAALDTDRPAIIVPSEGRGADPRDLEIYLRTWEAGR